MHPLARALQHLADNGSPMKKGSGENYYGRCPNHEDKHPSLTVTMGDKAVLITCHTGCCVEDIVARIGLTMADLFLPDGEGKRGLGEIEAAYPYRDENAIERYQVVRFEGKQFRQRRLVNGEWVWNLNGTEKLLFRLPEILDAISLGDTIYVAEGEKDVLALVAAGVQATCNSGGACHWPAAFGAILSNAEHVKIVADKDAKGAEHVGIVSASLNGNSHEIVVAAEGCKDAAEHFAKGYGLDDFVPYEIPAREVTVAGTSELRVVGIAEFVAIEEEGAERSSETAGAS